MKSIIRTRLTRLCLATVLGLLVSPLIGEAKAAAPDLDGTQWIWHHDAGESAGTWFFRKGFAFPAGEKAKKAEIVVTCDNLWTLYINGEEAGQNAPGSDSWRYPRCIDVTEHLVIEKNAIAIAGTNTMPSPAGLLVKLAVEFESGETFELTSDKTWISNQHSETDWSDAGFIGGPGWTPVTVLGAHGIAPWDRLVVGAAAPRASAEEAHVLPIDEEELENPIHDAGVVFVGGAVPLNANKQQIYVQNIQGTRAYFEMDPMTPAALGRQLWSVVPLHPNGKKTLLCDAGEGLIGSPSVSFDGRTVYFTMAKPGEAYFHIYKIDRGKTGDQAADEANRIVQLTDGPFHDYDPTELPDGRIAFSSTRLGSREEYHAKYASALFTCDQDGDDIRQLTYHIVADREPRVMADGSLVFIRSDNFLERAKVEVHLHQTHRDGTAGQVVIGPGRNGVSLDREVAAERPMNWLRRYGVGSPAPLPGGRVAAISQRGLVTSASATGQPVGDDFLPFDLCTMPDGRLLCTSKAKNQLIVFDLEDGSRKPVFTMRGIHSVVHLGRREKPRMMPSTIDPKVERTLEKTGYLYCQNVLDTQHKAADVRRIKAIRVYEGRPFTLEPTKTIYAHIGTVGVELGTVPLAEDGSFFAEVPADRPVALQAIDGEGRAVINELSWIYTRPGEMRSCVGCHAPVGSAPRETPGMAIRSVPLRLTGQGQPHRFRANNGANGGIANLQLDKFREVTSINLHDVGDEYDLSTIRRLGILRNRGTVPLLTRALKDPSVEMRVAAAISLSACGNRDAVPPLIDALGDPNRTVVRAASGALAHLTGVPEGSTDWDAIESALIHTILTDEELARLDDPSATRVDAAAEAEAPSIVIHSAVYGVPNDPAKQLDLTEKLREHVDAGSYTITSGLPFAGTDPARGIRKSTDIEYTLNGKRERVSLPNEGTLFDLRNPTGGYAGLENGQEVHMAIESLGHVGGERAKKVLRHWLENNRKSELRIQMAAIRSLGYLKDRAAVPLLVEIMNANLNQPGKGGWNEGGFNQKPVYLSATAAEALGRIGGKQAEKALLEVFPTLGNFEQHVFASGDHSWLKSSQPSPIYFRVLEALDRTENTDAGSIVDRMVMSIPSDKDRGLLYELDAYEKLTGRVIERSGRMDAVVEACLAVLGEERAEDDATIDPSLIEAVSYAPHNEKHIRKHSAPARAAQVLSVVCNDVEYADRIRTQLVTYRAGPDSETRAWVCFMLTRTLGRLGDVDSIPLLIAMLEQDPTEASLGLNPPPAHIIYKAWRPFYRPAAAWSLGELQARAAVPALLQAVKDLENASSTREQAAAALGKIGDPETLDDLEAIAEDYPEMMTRRALLESMQRISQTEVD